MPRAAHFAAGLLACDRGRTAGIRKNFIGCLNRFNIVTGRELGIVNREGVVIEPEDWCGSAAEEPIGASSVWWVIASASAGCDQRP